MIVSHISVSSAGDHRDRQSRDSVSINYTHLKLATTLKLSSNLLHDCSELPTLLCYPLL